ncbi:receptor [Branchiostoma belcheri]|nr:receptor [Branchiostoma belcheri]
MHTSLPGGDGGRYRLPTSFTLLLTSHFHGTLGDTQLSRALQQRASPLVTAQATCVTLAVLSLDRFWAIVRHFKTPWFRTPVGVLLTTTIIWIGKLSLGHNPPYVLLRAVYVQKRGQTTGDARAPYVPYGRSTCEYGKVAIAQRSYVVSTYNSLTTCATNDARNRSRPDVACTPHSYTLRNRARSFLLSLPVAFFLKVFEWNWHGIKQLVCLDKFPSADQYQGYIIYTVLISYVIPLTTSVGCHWLIIRYLATMSANTSVAQKHVMARKKKVTRMVATVVILFAVCWAPNHALNLWFAFRSEGEIPHPIMWLKITALCMSYANSSVNPFVYGIMGENFKKAFAKSFQKGDSSGTGSAVSPKTPKLTKEEEIGMIKMGGRPAVENKNTPIDGDSSGTGSAVSPKTPKLTKEEEIGMIKMGGRPAVKNKNTPIDASSEGELHRLWRDHVGIRPRYAGRGASASRSLTSDINNTPPCVLSSNSNKCSSSALCSDTVSQVCVARGPDVRNASYPNRGLGDSV